MNPTLDPIDDVDDVAPLSIWDATLDELTR